ncbi:uncharacterized protein BDZ99DRAFT_475739 [Mytilinidion resinicola]|uniref:Uncharacterized protein n=1 Tax=Mytilinidion resinicola TaxID=574789 RepID=A0A6A6YQQ3_9PEZI|nr:uncharacterized protein BDZ99DRAFT_475739 [Mytilinidion resinicola]KAF2810863.1 hypothetical protein BDZ99DRAFT_475739 [Mytilinidion resinicola]
MNTPKTARYSDIYHWWFNRPVPNEVNLPIDPLLLIEAPAIVQRRKGRPTGPAAPRQSTRGRARAPADATRRDPSQFEIVDQQAPAQRARRRGGGPGSRGGTSHLRRAHKTTARAERADSVSTRRQAD